MAAVDCTLYVDGVRVADTSAALQAGDPTVLAELDVTWGRATTVDQPQAATCRFVLEDPAGGAGFGDLIEVGAPVTVRARGDISTGDPVDVAVDGGFETLPPGPVTDRVHTSAAAATVEAGGYSGVQHIDTTGTIAGASVAVPPDAFDPSPTAWDLIPRFAAGQTWTWSLAVRPGYGVTVRVQAVGFAGPTVRVPVGPVAAPIAVGPGDGSWTVTGATLLSDRADTVWLGVQVTILSVWTWVETPGTWAERPGTWAAHGYTVDVDALTLDAPPTGLTRDVLVFSGRVTDLSASTPTPGGYQVEVIAVDQLAELANREVGDVPWTAETFTARVSRILTAAALDVDVIVDAGPIGGLTVSKRDVDSQPAANLLSEMAAGVDAVMWTAVHETLGGYLWFEDPATRAILSTLTEVGGVVVIVPAAPNRAPGRSVIDACQIPAGDVTWIRDVADVITRVDATWLDQTTTPPTERNTRVEDTAGIDLFGVRRYSLTTPLTTAVDADDTAARVLARSRQLDWRAEGVVWDVAMFPPAPGDPTAAVLDLLDGTVRIGRGIIIDGADTWPGIPAAATATGYLDGGRYLHGPAGWELGLYTTPAGGLGRSGPWTSLDPTWTWLMMDPDIAWSDLYGVTGPNVIVKGP